MIVLPHIMLVDDSDADIELIRLAFAEGHFNCALTIAHNGAEALEHLQKPDLAAPDLILLDLNMPQMDGKRFLALVKESERHRFTPIILLTSSRAAHDIEDCYQLNADGYIVKPEGFTEFPRMVNRIRDFLQRAA